MRRFGESIFGILVVWILAGGIFCSCNRMDPPPSFMADYFYNRFFMPMLIDTVVKTYSEQDYTIRLRQKEIFDKEIIQSVRSAVGDKGGLNRRLYNGDYSCICYPYTSVKVTAIDGWEDDEITAGDDISEYIVFRFFSYTEFVRNGYLWPDNCIDANNIAPDDVSLPLKYEMAANKIDNFNTLLDIGYGYPDIYFKKLPQKPGDYRLLLNIRLKDIELSKEFVIRIE